jgi:uncharacterized membrane protein YeaQ/YmgE (transglycosylase-associated protein family)
MVILWWIIVGLVAGWATGKIMKGGGYGFFGDVLLGIAGALAGGWIARHIGLGGWIARHLHMGVHGGMIGTILVAICGSIILVFLFRLVTGKR